MGAEEKRGTTAFYFGVVVFFFQAKESTKGQR